MDSPPQNQSREECFEDVFLLAAMHLGSCKIDTNVLNTRSDVMKHVLAQPRQISVALLSRHLVRNTVSALLVVRLNRVKSAL